MAVQIDETLTARKAELIRDRIAEILAEELPNQAALNSDADLDATVYLERLIPVSNEELPVVNVFIAEGDFERFTSLSQTGEYKFVVDVFHKGVAEGSGVASRGDTISSKKSARLAGVIQAILSHFKYRQLGFANNFINRVEVQKIEFLEPISAQDAANVTKARLLLMVSAEETIKAITPKLLEGFDTAVKLGITDFGYVYSGDNPPIIPTVCDPVTVKNSDDTYIQDVSSGGVLIVPDSNVSNSDNTYSVELPATIALELPDITHTDSNGFPSILPAQTPMVCMPLAAPTYSTAPLSNTGMTSSVVPGDDGSLQNGKLVDFFTLIESIAEITGSTNPNYIGNTKRFTDINGLQVYADGIMIDWSLYGGSGSSGYYTVPLPIDNNDDMTTDTLALSVGIFSSGWALWNRTEGNNLVHNGTGFFGVNVFSWSPLNLPAANYWTGTGNPSVGIFINTVYGAQSQLARSNATPRGVAVRFFTDADLSV